MPDKHKHKYKLRKHRTLIYAECECGDSWMNIRDNIVWAMLPFNARVYWKHGWLRSDTYESAGPYLKRMEMLE